VKSIFAVFLTIFLLNATENITVVTTSNWEPFNMVHNHKLEGIGIDFWRLVAKKAGIKYKFKIVNQWCDVLKEIKQAKAHLTPSADITQDRVKYAVFSKAYVTYPLVIATKNDVGFIFDVESLKNKKIAVGKNFTAAKKMKQKYPFINYVYVESTDKALDLVNSSEVFGAIDILPVIAYKIGKYEYKDLKISGQIPIDFHVRFMLSKKYESLLPKINYAIDQLSYNEKEKIYQKYVKPPKKLYFTSNEMVFYFLIAASILIMIILWIYVLINELKSLKRKKTQYTNDCDRLTGIYNYSKIEEIVNEKLKNKEVFSVILFDIIDFKSINRFYGHHFGDITLLELVSVIKSMLGKNDVFGRIKGGTFIIIIDETEIKACEKAKRIFEKIRDFDFSIVNRLKCTFVVKTVYNESDFESLLFKTEKELLMSKRNSRVFKC